MATPPEAHLFVGQVLDGRFEVRSFLGRGGFSLVFIARDQGSGTEVALKVLHSVASEAAIEFATERDLLSLFVASSNVVTLLQSGSGTIDVTVPATGAKVQLPVEYIALELADSRLTDLLIQLAKVSWVDRLTLLRGVVKGVHQLHLASVVHRDLKSENVLLFSGPARSFDAKIADLGRSRRVTNGARFPARDYERGRGDLRFAPPELVWLQGRDDRDCWRRVDLYHIGAVFFELATGQPLTALVFGDAASVVRNNLRIPEANRAQEFAAQLPSIRARYELAYELFGAALPSGIRGEALRLLRHLTDPKPEERDQRLLISGRLRMAPDLQWVLRRIDILLLELRVTELQARRRGRKAG
jgi:eukaryotic-like serine/threonine-protein kinase